MTKEYSSNLTQDQFELIEPLLPAEKPGGRPRSVCLWSILNGILDVVVNGCKWRDLPGDLPPWQTVYTYFRNWRKDGTWQAIHTRLRGWTRAVAGRPERAWFSFGRFWVTFGTLSLPENRVTELPNCTESVTFI